MDDGMYGGDRQSGRGMETEMRNGRVEKWRRMEENETKQDDGRLQLADR